MSLLDTPTITLSGDVEIPQLGYGVFQIPASEAQAATETALEVGYRHIDTAAAYNNETGVGAAMRASGIARDELFVTTKLRNGDQGYDTALQAYDDSLDRLGLDRVDLYLVHWPSPARGQFGESWRALAKLLEQGRVRAIGVSNFLEEHLAELFATSGIVPAVNQLEVHPTFRQPSIVDFTREHGIAVEAYSPLGQAQALEIPAIVDLAARYDRTPAQIVLRWHMQNGTIAIPKSVSRARMVENFSILDFTLDDDAIAAIDGLDSVERIGGDPRTMEMSQIR